MLLSPSSRAWSLMAVAHWILVVLSCEVSAVSGQRSLSISRGPSQPAVYTWDPFEATESLCCNTHGTHDVQDMQDMHSTFTRRLHQNEQGSAGSGASEQVLAVFTPVELQQAIEDGVTHIEIQQHMALSTLPLRGLRNSELTAVLGGVPSSVLSIQGNCTEPPSQALLSRAGLLPESLDAPAAAPLRPLKPGQCLLLTDSSVLFARQGRLWLHNLYLRLRTTSRTRSADLPPALVSVTDAPAGQLYMTNVTLQGSASYSSTGLYVSSGAYAADCEFVDLGVDMAPVRVLVRGASAAFHRCTFSGNSVPSPQVGIITTSVHAVAVRLEGCMFDGSGGSAFGGGGGVPRSLVDANGSALIFSNPELDVWRTEEAAAVAGAASGSGDGTRTTTRPLSDIPRNITFLDASDAWLQSVQEATRLGTRVQLVDSDKAGGLGTGILAIIIVVLLVPLVGLAAALVLWARRRTRMAADSDSAPKAEQATDFSFHASPGATTPPAQEDYPDLQQFGGERPR